MASGPVRKRGSYSPWSLDSWLLARPSRALLLLDFPSRPLGWAPRLLFWGAAALLLGTLLRRSWIVAALGWEMSTFSAIYLAALMVVLAASSQRWSLLYPSRVGVASV